MQNFEENTQQTHTQQHRSSLVVLCCCCCCCCCCFVHHKWTKQKFTGSHSKPSHTVYCVLLICGQQRRIKPVCYIISQQLDHSVKYQYHCGGTFTWQFYNTIGSHSKCTHISSSCCSCYSIICIIIVHFLYKSLYVKIAFR